MIQGDALKGKRVFEFPRPAYSLVQDVKAQLGAMAACEVECVLAGQITGFHNLDSDELRIVRSLAEERGVQLP